MPAVSIMVKPVSGACNMNCRYCFYSDVMARRETAIYPKMSIEALEVLVRRAFRYADGPVSFSFQGGEPTLAGPEFYDALVRFERMYNTRGLPVHNAVQTNGYALSDEMIDLFAREHFFLGVSLDGDAVAHDGMRPDRAGAPAHRKGEPPRPGGVIAEVELRRLDGFARADKLREASPGRIDVLVVADGLGEIGGAAGHERELACLRVEVGLLLLAEKPLGDAGVEEEA